VFIMLSEAKAVLLRKLVAHQVEKKEVRERLSDFNINSGNCNLQ
jgi:hypothetical protein